MTRERTHRGPDGIDWKVVAIHDPSEQNQEFAYTIGLAKHGTPELHVWARPPDGDDPGGDFALSSRDMGMVLNRFGHRLVAGEVGAGSEVVETMDLGLTTVTWRLSEPVRAETVDAYMLDPDQPVLELRWSLRRPVPQPVLVSPARIDAATRQAVARAGRVPPHRTVPELGPFAPVVSVLRGSVRAMPPGRAAMLAAGEPNGGSVLGYVETVCRTAMRSTAFRHAVAAAESDARHIFPAATQDDRDLAHALAPALAGSYASLAVLDELHLDGTSVDDPPDAAERTLHARELLAVVEAAAYQEWAGGPLRAHPAFGELVSACGDDALVHVGDRYDALDWRSLALGAQTLTAVARAGLGWLDDACAQEVLLIEAGVPRLTPGAVNGLAVLAATHVALAERLPDVDPHALRRLARRLRSPSRRAA